MKSEEVVDRLKEAAGEKGADPLLAEAAAEIELWQDRWHEIVMDRQRVQHELREERARRARMVAIVREAGAVLGQFALERGLLDDPDLQP